MTSQPSIIWPSHYTPGTTSNFVSNEIIASNLTSTQIWAKLNDITQWPTYYWNASEITPPPSGPHLQKGDSFQFSTFGFPPLPCTCVESIPPTEDATTSSSTARLAWEAVTGEGEDKIHVYHAWLVQDLPGGRVRILTQESQIGKVFEDFRTRKPNPMLNGHQDWLEGLVASARGEPSSEPGEWSREYRR